MIKIANVSVYDYDRVKICDLYDSENNIAGSAYNIEFTKNFNGVNSLSFNLPYKLDNEVNFRWQYMQSDYLIRLHYNGVNEWFVASKPQKSKDKSGVIGNVKCNGLPALLKTKNIYGEFDDENGIGKISELMPKVLAGSGWTLGHCDIIYEKDGTTEKVRSLISSGKKGSLDLINTLCNLFRCRPEYDTENLTVNIYAITNRDQAFEGEVGRNLDALSVSEDSENLATRLYVEGEYSENGYIGIDDVNPTGLTYLLNFDYYRKIGVFKQRHEDALQAYLTDIQDVNTRIKANGQLINQQNNAINEQIGQCDVVLYYTSSGFVIPAHIYGNPTENQKQLVVGDKVIVLNTNKTFRYATIETTPEALIQTNDYGIAKFVTPAAGVIGSQEVQVEAKEKEIANLQRKINATTKADKIAEYTQEIANLNSQINTIYNTSGTGLYARMHNVMKKTGLLKVLDDYLANHNVLRLEQDGIEATFIAAMGNMLRDGYWQNNNYALGQEQALYDDAVEMSNQLAFPEYSYSLDYIRSTPLFLPLNASTNLTQYEDVPIEDVHINAIMRINDDDLDVHENMFVEKIVIGIDKDNYGIIDVTNNDLTINSNDLGSLLSRMSQLADLIDQKNQLYERAKAFSSNGTLYADRLNGQINVIKTQLLSTVSSWYTDDQGNIMFESADGGSAMMLCGAGWMIASSKTEDGEWDWRTAATGQGITADEIVAGFISAERIEAGSIATSKLMPDVGNTLIISGNPAIVDLEQQMAPEFDPTVSYTKGQMVMHDGQFYVFTQNHPAGAWNENHVVSSSLGVQIELLPDQIIEYVGEQGYNKTYIQATDPALDPDKHVTTGDYWIKKAEAKKTWNGVRASSAVWNDYITWKWEDLYIGISEIYCRNSSGQWIQVYNTDIIATAYTQIRQTQDQITQEAYRANAAEGVLQSRITQTATQISQEISRATAAEANMIEKTGVYQTADAIAAVAARNVAPAFSKNKNYSIGDVVSYDGKVYKFTTAHPAGDWNDEHVTATNSDAVELSRIEQTATEIRTYVGNTYGRTFISETNPASTASNNVKPGDYWIRQMNPAYTWNATNSSTWDTLNALTWGNCYNGGTRMYCRSEDNTWVAVVDSRITDRAYSQIVQTQDKIELEVARASSSEGVLRSRITQTEKDITSEVTRATGAEGTLSTRITQTADAITSEVTRATGAESTLSSSISQAAGDITALSQRVDNDFVAKSMVTISDNKIELSSLKFNSLGTSSSGIYITPTQIKISSDGYFSLRSTNFNVTNAGVITSTAGTIAGWKIEEDSLSKLDKSGTIVASHVGMRSTSTGTDGIAFYAGKSENIDNCAFKVSKTGKVWLTKLYVRVVDTSAPGYDEDDPNTWTWIDSEVDLGQNAYKIGPGYQTIVSVSTTGVVRLSGGSSFNTAASIQLEGAGWSGGKYAVKAFYTTRGGTKTYVGSPFESDQVSAGFFSTSDGFQVIPYYMSGGNRSAISGSGRETYTLAITNSSGAVITSTNYSRYSYMSIVSGNSRISGTPTDKILSVYWDKAHDSVVPFCAHTGSEEITHDTINLDYNQNYDFWAGYQKADGSTYQWSEKYRVHAPAFPDVHYADTSAASTVSGAERVGTSDFTITDSTKWVTFYVGSNKYCIKVHRKADTPE